MDDFDHALLIEIPLSEMPIGSDKELQFIVSVIQYLDDTFDKSEVADYDGYEFREASAVLFVYGKNAQNMFDAVEKKLRAMPFPTGSLAVLEFGDPNLQSTKIFSVPISE